MSNTGLPVGALIGIIAGVVVLILLAILIIFLLKKKNSKPKVKINEEFINTLIEYFGGVANINAVATENGGRLNITVNDLDLLNTDGIKSLAASGVFITGNTVKTLYREDSATIKMEIEKRI